jgi:hypothetical protein
MMEALLFAVAFAAVFALLFAIIGEENVRALGPQGPRAWLLDSRILTQREALAQLRARMPRPVGATALMSGRKLTIRRP